jgi:hypothetical protein
MSRTRASGRDPRVPRTAPRRPASSTNRVPVADEGQRATTSRRPDRASAQRAPGAVATLDPAQGAATSSAASAVPEPATEAAGSTPRTNRTGRATRSSAPPRAPRHRLLLACMAVLTVGLVGVLLLNTIISQGAFRQHELEIKLILLAEKEEALARAVQLAESPIEVEKKARALGMVPAAAPVFLRLSDGKLLGEPVPAPEPTGPVDFAGAPGIQPTQAASATPAAADPSTGIDPALDPSTGVVPTSAGPTSAAAPGVTQAAAPTPTAAASPAPSTPAPSASGSPAPSAPAPSASGSPGPASPTPITQTQQGVTQ